MYAETKEIRIRDEAETIAGNSPLILYAARNTLSNTKSQGRHDSV